MPEFAPSEARVAIAPITAKPAGMDCEAELFLGPDDMTKVATSGKIPFVSTGAAKNVSLPITMPSTPGTYHVYIDVFTNGMRFLAYQAIEDVTIAPVGVAEFAYVSVVRVFGVDLEGNTLQSYSQWADCQVFEVDVENRGNGSGECILKTYVAIDTGHRPWTPVWIPASRCYSFSAYGWTKRYTGGIPRVLSATIEPGQVVTFREITVYHFFDFLNYIHLKFVGPPGEVSTAVPVGAYA